MHTKLMCPYAKVFVPLDFKQIFPMNLSKRTTIIKKNFSCTSIRIVSGQAVENFAGKRMLPKLKGILAMKAEGYTNF